MNIKNAKSSDPYMKFQDFELVLPLSTGETLLCMAFNSETDDALVARIQKAYDKIKGSKKPEAVIKEYYARYR
jgi:hypothetical protein